MYSNRYIFIYATIMVTIVAAILSAAAMILQPFQDKNVRIEKMQQILASAGIESTPQNAMELYDKSIIKELAVNAAGDIVGVYENGSLASGKTRAFDIDLRAELRKAIELKTGKSTQEPVYPLFICRHNERNIYIIPLLGRGLWGPVWGNIALEEDYNTVAGVIFDHKSETPGLGAEISEREYQKTFQGKKIMDEAGEFTSIKLVKGGVANSTLDPLHGVDAISGGTITSDGVSDMIKDCLGVYLPFFKQQIKSVTPEISENQQD